MRTQDIFDNKNITANSKQLAILKRNFPQCFDKSGKFDIETLSQILGVENIKKEGFELKFLGKSYARLTANLNPKTLLMPDIDHNSKNENAQNLLIKGDNLEVLKHLKNAYFESIKMIYIDPPYNTGSDGFVYKDDRKFSIDELSSLAGISQEEAKRVLEFTAKGSNSHSAWLSFIYPRLYIARELLRDDGVIFISIDDNEQAQLKILCDEIFGEDSFVACCPRITKFQGKSTNEIAKNNDWLFCYAKTMTLKQNEVNEEDYFKQDEFFKERGGYKTNQTLDYNSLQYSKTMDYEIDIDGKKFYAGSDFNSFQERKNGNHGSLDWVWRWSKDKFKFGLENGFIEIINNRIYTKTYFKAKISKKKPYKIEFFERTKAISSLEFTNSKYSNDNSTKELQDIFKIKNLFNYPKNTGLLKFLIYQTTSDTDIILDFFAGSGTTAHAVMAQNLEDGGNRKFILVQLDEKIDERNSKVAYDFCKNELKSKNPTIFDITKERILRAEQSLSEDDARLKFKIFSTVPLLKSYLDKYLDGDSDTKELNLFPKNELSKDDLTALLTTFTAYDGIKLKDELKRVDLGVYEAYYAQKKLYLINENFNGKNLKALVEKIDSDKEFAPEKIVIYEPSFESSRWRELDEAIKNYANKKNLQISLIVRH